MEQHDDPYSILGVPKSASAADIKKVYRKLALKYHPDKTDPDDKASHDKFAKIASAYELLSDPGKREQYDIHQRLGGNGYDSKHCYEPKQQRSPSQTTYTSNPPNQTYTYPPKTTFKQPSTPTNMNSSKPSKMQPQQRRKSCTGNQGGQPNFTSNPSTSNGNGCNNNKNMKLRRHSTTTGSMPQMTGNNVGKDDVQSMSTNTRTRKHPDGRLEYITETVTTYFDGRTEKQTKSSFSAPTNNMNQNKMRQNTIPVKNGIGSAQPKMIMPNHGRMMPQTYSPVMQSKKVPMGGTKRPTQTPTQIRTKPMMTTTSQPKSPSSAKMKVPSSSKSNKKYVPTSAPGTTPVEPHRYQRTVKSSGY